MIFLFMTGLRKQFSMKNVTFSTVGYLKVQHRNLNKGKKAFKIRVTDRKNIPHPSAGSLETRNISLSGDLGWL